MKVLFVASELTPIAKVGGLGDVIGSLPKALAELGIEVKIIIPLYGIVNKKQWSLKRFTIHNFLFKNEEQKMVLWKTKLPDSQVEVFLVENKKYLSTGPIYFEKTAFVGGQKEIDRFSFFSKSVFEILNKELLNWRPSIIHCHDWHTGFLVKLLKNRNLTHNSKSIIPKVVFTIHNLANQGITADGVNLMAEGIKNTDVATTVSETYAQEIQTQKYGDGLEALMEERAKKNKLIGILNGIDYEFWGKMAHQHDHQKGFPRFGLVARLTQQKGLSLLLPIIPHFVEKHKAEFLLLGIGSEKFEKGLEILAKKYPKKINLKIGFDEKLAHRIYASSDFFLMPSLFEPSGLGQMIAMHYGTIPIVRATGGLKDSVKHLTTGLVFKNEDPDEFREVMDLAIQIFNDKKWLKKLSQSCKKEDFSWRKSAKKYLAIYKKLMKNKTAY